MKELGKSGLDLGTCSYLIWWLALSFRRHCCFCGKGSRFQVNNCDKRDKRFVDIVKCLQWRTSVSRSGQLFLIRISQVIVVIVLVICEGKVWPVLWVSGWLEGVRMRGHACHLHRHPCLCLPHLLGHRHNGGQRNAPKLLDFVQDNPILTKSKPHHYGSHPDIIKSLYTLLQTMHFMKMKVLYCLQWTVEGYKQGNRKRKTVITDPNCTVVI